jgi:hypothetical protein
MSTIEEVAKDFYSGERRFELHTINNISDLETKYQEYVQHSKIENAPNFEELRLFLEKKFKVFRVKDDIEVLWQFLLPYTEFPKSTDETFKNNLKNAVYIVDNPAKKSKHGSAIRCLNIIKTHDTLLDELVGKYIMLAIRGKNCDEKNGLKETLLKTLDHLTW